MPDISKQILDISLHNAISLEGFSNEIVAEIIGFLNLADKDVFLRILRRGEDGTFTTSKLKKLFTEIKLMIDESYWEAQKKLHTAMGGLVLYESQSAAAMLATQVAVNFNLVQPTAEQLAAIVSKAPITVGTDKKLLLEEIFKSLAAGKEENIRGAIRLGMVEGENAGQMIQRLQGTRANQYRDGIIEQNRRGAEAIVRTVTNHVSNQSRQLTYQANSDVVKGWVYVATLDGRVCGKCWPNSGKRFDIGSGPIPPIHVRCRCCSIPELRSLRELGFDMSDMPASFRASHTGTVAADITFSDWLKTQDAGTQRDILGTTRQKLFADGGMDVDRFASKAGAMYNLKELKARNESTFVKVFG